jgi:hypothetical protein
VIPYDDTTACILLFIGIHKKQAQLEFQRRLEENMTREDAMKIDTAITAIEWYVRIAWAIVGLYAALTVAGWLLGA